MRCAQGDYRRRRFRRLVDAENLARPAQAFEQEGAEAGQLRQSAGRLYRRQPFRRLLAHQQGMGELAGHGGQAGGDGDGFAEGRMGAPVGRTEGTHQGLAGFEADADGQGFEAGRRDFGKEASAGLDQGVAGGEGAHGVIGAGGGGVPDRHDGVADVFLDHAAMGLDDAGGGGEEGLEQGGGFVGRPAFAVGGEIADIDEQHADNGT